MRRLIDEKLFDLISILPMTILGTKTCFVHTSTVKNSHLLISISHLLFVPSVDGFSAAEIVDEPQNKRQDNRNNYTACYRKVYPPVFAAELQIAGQLEEADPA